MKNCQVCSIKRIVFLLTLFLTIGMAGCTTALPAIIPALSSSLQDPELQPKLVWVPRDEKFYSWRGDPVSDGWIAYGQEYNASSIQIGRIDYYNQDGRLKWSYKRPDTGDSSSYYCAVQRPDGSIIACGRNQIGLDPEVALLTALDKNGQPIWETQLDYPADANLGLAVVQCLIDSSGRIYVVIFSSLYNIPIYEGEQPILVACYEADGQLIWQKKLDFTGMTDEWAAALAGEKGIYLSIAGFELGDQTISDPYAWLLKIDQNGNESWRTNLVDSRYQCRPAAMAVDSSGNILLSCKANYLGEIPEMPEKSEIFHDRFRYYSYHPAALIKFSDRGKRIWTRYINGEFGAGGQQVVFNNKTIYWKLNLIDDIVEPLPYMSIDHRTINHDILLTFNSAGKQQLCHQFTREETGSQVIQRFDDGQPVLIGYEPYKLPDE